MNSFFEKMLINTPKGERADRLDKEMKDALKNAKIFIAISLLCFAIFALYPIHAFVNEQRLIPIMRIEFPFLDQTTMKGYLIGLAIMLVFAILGVAGSVAFDLMVLQLLLQYGSLVTQLILDFDEYHEIWENKNKFSAEYRDHFLKNILLKYEDINGCERRQLLINEVIFINFSIHFCSYIRYFNKLFSANTCQSICILYGSLICSVYAVFNVRTITITTYIVKLLLCKNFIKNLFFVNLLFRTVGFLGMDFVFFASFNFTYPVS